jgi:mannose-6-phosphate isomerase-like protein (cupin superfamily)
MVRIFALPLLVSAALAADPTGFNHWTSAGLKALSKSLASKINAQKLAGQPLASYGNHGAAVSHREGDGVAELHENQNDIFVVQTGEATLVVGGEIVDPKPSGAGEVRGPSIRNGVKKVLKPGDIVHIPFKTPHQLLVQKEFTYFVVKVDGK